MPLTAKIKELKASTHARNLPLQVQFMGDEDAPVYKPWAALIKPKKDQKWKPFDKHCIGGRDSDNNYIVFTAVGQKEIEKFKKVAKAGTQSVIKDYKVRTENERFYAPPLGFSVDCSAAAFEKPKQLFQDLPPWRPTHNIASIMAKKTERRPRLRLSIVRCKNEPCKKNTDASSLQDS